MFSRYLFANNLNNEIKQINRLRILSENYAKNPNDISFFIRARIRIYDSHECPAANLLQAGFRYS